jgi:integrase
MSIRERRWRTRKGEEKSAWVLDYVDQNGKRHIETFARKKDALDRETTVRVDVRSGTHTAHSTSVTVAEAGERWLKVCELGDNESGPLERASIDQYRTHLTFHILPFIGGVKLSKLTVPAIGDLQTKLRTGADGRKPRSSTMIRKVIHSLGAILGQAQADGLVARNVVRERSQKRKRRTNKSEQGRPLEIGRDIPALEEIRAIVGALEAEGRWRPLLLTAIFTGLRASELRGLRWVDVDLAKAELHVRQRADRYLTIGAPKSDAGNRTVPLPPIVVTALRTWRLACPKGPLDLVLPNDKEDAGVERYKNIIRYAWHPAQMRAGVSKLVKDKVTGKVVLDGNGEPRREPKYLGLHALRHFYASCCINRKADGGLELPAKVVQTRLGHSTIAMTLDVYGHLFPTTDDRSDLDAMQKAILG